jgi:hypothetical protein
MGACNMARLFGHSVRFYFEDQRGRQAPIVG